MKRRIRVAVVDSGWDYRISDGRVMPGIGLVDECGVPLVEPAPNAQDSLGHGTKCADIILHRAPFAEILPIRIFGESLESTPRLLVDAIDQAIKHEARLINLSLSTSRLDAVRPLFAACERALAANVIIVATVAPYRHPCESYPSAFMPVIGVGGGSMPPGAFTYHGNSLEEVTASSVVLGVRGLAGIRSKAVGASFATAFMTGWIADRLLDNPQNTIAQVRLDLGRHSPRATAGGAIGPDRTAIMG